MLGSVCSVGGLVCVSAVLTNDPYILNLDCDHYINNSKALREAMCFMMDPNLGKKVCYVQFPQRFYGIDRNDRYANHNTIFFDINLKGLDGIQGPVYVGTGRVFNMQALYGYEPPLNSKAQGLNCYGPRKKSKKPTRNMMLRKKKRFGQSPVFLASTLMENSGMPQSATPAALLKETIHVINCGYEDKTDWGKEIGWIYGFVTEDILTGFKMRARGWQSIYCMPPRFAFKGFAPINLSDRLN
eukprot:Gb_28102 [translate_table: standard]